MAVGAFEIAKIIVEKQAVGALQDHAGLGGFGSSSPSHWKQRSASSQLTALQLGQSLVASGLCDIAMRTVMLGIPVAEFAFVFTPFGFKQAEERHRDCRLFPLRWRFALQLCY